MALCGVRCVNLHEDTIKILGIHYSYNEQIENDENVKKHVAKIEMCQNCEEQGTCQLKRKLQFSNHWLYLK